MGQLRQIGFALLAALVVAGAWFVAARRDVAVGSAVADSPARSSAEAKRDATGGPEVPGQRAVVARREVAGSRAEPTFGGTVIDAVSGLPLANVLVELRGRELAKERVRTDASGRFGFPRDHVGHLWLTIGPQAGFRAADPLLEVSDELRSGAVEVVLRARRVPSAVVRGALVYVSTGQGIPGCGLELRGAGTQRERLTTDADGRFTSRSAFDLGELEVVVLENRPSQAPALLLQHDGVHEAVVALDFYPTVIVAGAFPGGLDAGAFVAWLRPDGFEWSATLAALRKLGDTWFCRASSGVCSTSASRTTFWVFEIHDKDMLHSARALLADFEGVTVVQPDWQECGGISVALVDPPEAPTWKLELELFAPDAVDSVRQITTSVGRLTGEPLVLGGLAPGPYRLHVSSALCEEVDLAVNVRPLELSRAAIRLPCPVPRGAIRGEIVFDSGDAATGLRSLQPRLWSEAGLPLDLEVEVSDAGDSGGGYARLEIADVPDGAFHLTLDSQRWSVVPANDVSVRAGDFVRFRVLDTAPLVELGFRVFDAETGIELETFDAYVVHDSDRLEFHAQPSGALVLDEVPETAPLRWSVSSPGYRCVAGDLTRADEGLERVGERRWIRVALEKGWAVTVRVWLDARDAPDARDEQRPLPGATVLADGIAVSTTDADGYAQVALAARPSSLEVRYRDWSSVESGLERRAMFAFCWEFPFTLGPAR